MPFSLIPKLILPSLTDLTPELLAARGVRFLMLDFDNTIVPYTTNEPAEAMTAWLRRMQASEIRLCVVSNSRKPRVVDALPGTHRRAEGCPQAACQHRGCHCFLYLHQQFLGTV